MEVYSRRRIKKIQSINLLTVLLVVFTTFTFTACYQKEEQAEPDLSLKEKVYKVMDEWYLWYDKMPKKVDVSLYDNADELLNALMYKKYDKWSYIEKEEVEEKYYEAGQYVGRGFGLKWDYEGKLRVSFIYKNTSAYREGIRRAWQVVKVNGLDVDKIKDWNKLLGENVIGVKNIYEFVDTEGKSKTINLTKEVVNMNTVLHRDVILSEGKRIAYLAFKNFINLSKAELDEAFSVFETNTVDELVLDLRYNGGGLLKVAQYLVSKIAPINANGKTFVGYKHNNKRKDKDETWNIEKKNNLNLSRVIILVSSSTASASETVINSLRPYMEVKLIGDNNTSGKPVGMYSFTHKGYEIVPICFQTVNAKGFGDYFDGFKPDAHRHDGLDKDLGDVNESMLSEALYYIKHGSFSGVIAKKSAKATDKNADLPLDYSGNRAMAIIDID